MTTDQPDPNFTGQQVSGDIEIEIPDSPCGRIHVFGYETVSPLSPFRQKEIPIPEGGSAIILPITPTKVHCYRGVTAQLVAGCFAQVPGTSFIFEGRGIVIHTPDYAGLTQIGGPIESRGRLKYIDGCSDSLLVCPALYGEPCLNHLHIPGSINQSQHTHPSDRIGIIIRGQGECRTPVATYPLKEGMFWRIPAGGIHSFHTSERSSLEVFAWHPDSEFGPRHDDHPMLTRTIVDGSPASDERHVGIRTKEITN